MSKDKNISNKMLEIFGIMTISIGISLYRLFVIVKMWNLFGTYYRFPLMNSMWQAFALSLLTNIFTMKYDEPPKFDDDFTLRSFSVFVAISFTWLLAHWCFG